MVSFAADQLVFSADFHIGISTSGTIDWESILSDSGTTDYGRSCYYAGGLWYRFADDAGPDYNFLIKANLCSPICYANADADNNGIGLTVADLSYLAAFINGCGPVPAVIYNCNLNGDGIIDTMDIKVYQNYFTYGLSAFVPYGGYPVPGPCNPIPSPRPDTVNIFGLEHVSAGTTCLGVSGGQLTVTRFTADMTPDGVTVDIPDAISSPPSTIVWRGELRNPDQGDILPAGAALETEFSFPIPITGRIFTMSISQTKAAANTWNLAVQSSAAACSVKAFNNGTQVYATSAGGATGLGYVVETAKGIYPVGFKGSTSGKPASVVASSDYDFTASPNGVRWTWAGHSVSNLQIDYLSISTNIDVSCTGLSSVGIYAQQMDSLTIASETCSFGYGDAMVTPLGNATVTPVETTLVVGNIGPSGSDGVAAQADKDDGIWSITIANPDPIGALPVSASLGTEFFFATPTHPDSLSMRISMTKAAANNWNLAVASAAGTSTIKAFNNGSQVYSRIVAGTTGLGYIVETPKGVYPTGFKGSTTGKPASVVASADYDFTASPNGVRWTWAAQGVSNLQIDYLSISTEVPGTRLFGVTHTRMCGDNGAKVDPISFTILDVEVVPSYICGDANGDGAIDISDAVFLIQYIFSGGPAPNPIAAGDANCDGSVDISDVVYLIQYIFAGGPAPCGACK